MTQPCHRSRREIIKISAAGGALLAAGVIGRTFAQTFPSRAITWMVGQAPGGSPDISSRIIEPVVSKTLNVPMGIQNVAGADGRVARARLYNARPNGYTLLTDNSNSMVLGEIFYGGAYKSEEFEPIFGWERTGYQLCVKKSSAIKTFADLAAETRKRRVLAGTIGLGSDAHLQMLLITNQLNMPMPLVHFDGSGAAYAALLGGHVDVVIAGAASGARNHQTLHFLCVTNTTREFALPDVPTIKELGYPVEVLVRIWFALTTPKVPQDAVKVLSAAFKKAFEDKQVTERLAAAGISPTVVSREEIIPAIIAFKASSARYKGLMLN